MSMSLRAFARQIGVTHRAVQRAIDEGRLKESMGTDDTGALVVVDAEQAAAEWEANTRPYTRRDHGQPAPSQMAAATLRERTARAELIELETAKKRRELVPVAAVSARWEKIAVALRNEMLALPTRARQRLPHLSTADVMVLDALIREALEGLADRRGGAAPEGATT
jgi:phage terminase Nu1 subunit (DNA packaging protein)